MPGPYPLPTLSVTIDGTGISAPTFEDIFASLVTAYQQIYGSDTDLDPDSQDGQWLAIQAQGFYDANQALIAGYLAYSPSTAQGIGLSSVVKINGIDRLAPSRSTVELRCVGQPGTVLSGNLASDGYSQWRIGSPVVIPPEGQISATAVSEAPGSVLAGPNTITRIVTHHPGWQSVTNPAAADPGDPVESDATLRRRQSHSTALPAITPRESLYAAVANVPGVGRVAVHDNDSDFYDADEVPPHSVAIIIEGGDAATIAQAIVLKKNTGCGTYGNSHHVVYDSHGVPNPVNWFYLEIVPVFVAIQIEPLQGYLESTGALIVASVAEEVDDSEIGEEIYAGRLYAPANLAGESALRVTGLSVAVLNKLSQTYVVRDIKIGTTLPPDKTDVTIEFNQAAACNASNVTMRLAV